jgi:excisionase family DNA binding protein
MQDSRHRRGPNESERETPVRPLLLTAEQAGACLAIGRTKVYELLRAGELESIQIGSCRRIPTAAVEAYIERLAQESEPVAAYGPARETIPHEQRIR